MSVCCKISLLVGWLVCHSFLKLQASYTSNAPIGGLVSDRLRAELSTLTRPRSRLWRPSRSTTAGAPLSDRGSVTGCSLAFCQMHRFTRATSAFWPKNYEATCICNLYLRDLYVCIFKKREHASAVTWKDYMKWGKRSGIKMFLLNFFKERH